MRTIAFVGPSGTGKSHRSMIVAKQNGADYVIDDGLLICNSKVVAGTSAKKESTRLASVKHALFLNDRHAHEMKNALHRCEPKCVMILGTSDKMVEQIANRLGMGAIEKTIYITEVATPEEIKLAHKMRSEQGQHVIPVPTFEIKQEFSGYFLHPLRIFQRNLGNGEQPEALDKSIIRPTFSYMGDYTISDNVLIDIAKYETERIDGVLKMHSTAVRKTEHGVHLDMTITVLYGYPIPELCKNIRRSVARSIEACTSVNTRRIHIYVKACKV